VIIACFLGFRNGLFGGDSGSGAAVRIRLFMF
jgi:hypothetical protein